MDELITVDNNSKNDNCKCRLNTPPGVIHCDNPVFVKLNAIDRLEGDAFTISIYIYKNFYLFFQFSISKL